MRWSRRPRSTGSARSTCQPAWRHAPAAQDPDAGRARISGQHHLPPQQLLLPRATPRGCLSRARSIWSRASATTRPSASPGGNYSGVDLRCIVTNLCVMDFGGTDNAIRVICSIPGVTLRHGSGRDRLCAGEGCAGRNALPDGAAAGDHRAARSAQYPRAVVKDNPPASVQSRPLPDELANTPLTEALGCRVPVIQTAMGWIAKPALVAATQQCGRVRVPRRRGDDARRSWRGNRPAA